MIELLAAATETIVQPSPLQTWGPLGAAILILTSPKGLALVKSLLGMNGNGNGNGKYNPDLCKRLHAEIDKDRDETREEIRELRKESRENFQTVFNKIDGLHARQGRNPN